MPVSAEGRVKHQKLNPASASAARHFILSDNIQHMKMNGMVRTTVYFFFGMSNRVEHQKLNQVGAEPPPG